VLFDQQIPSSWIWRRLTKKDVAPIPPGDRAGVITRRR